MDKIGKITIVDPVRTGTSQRGNWASQTFVMECQDRNYVSHIQIEIYGSDKIDRFKVEVGQTVQVWFDIDAHEYNGRWYNSVRAWDVRPYEAQQTNEAQQTTDAAQASAAPQQ